MEKENGERERERERENKREKIEIWLWKQVNGIEESEERRIKVTLRWAFKEPKEVTAKNENVSCSIHLSIQQYLKKLKKTLENLEYHYPTYNSIYAHKTSGTTQ